MKVTVTRNINISNKRVAEEGYTNFTEYIRIGIAVLLNEKYDIDYEIADKVVRNMPKHDFIEIVENYLEELKDDRFERYLEIKNKSNDSF